MLYPFMTGVDGTKMFYSEIRKQNGKKNVLIVCKRWNKVRKDFDYMECLLPYGKWERVNGFSKKEVEKQYIIIKKLEKILFSCARYSLRHGKPYGSYDK